MELKSKRDRLQVGLLLLPGLLVFALFTVYPIGKLLYMSFLQWDLGSMQHQKFIGLQNYIDVLSDKTFRIAFANTLIYTLVTVPGQMILGLLAAVLINAIPRFRVTFRVIYYIPVITSWVIVSLVFQYMFNNSDRGLINYLLVDVLHVMDDYVPWLLREWSGNAAIWLMGIWKNVGWSMLVYLAALQGIPKERYEAAELDGAGLWKKFWHITMPGLRPTTFYVMVNMIIGSFNVFIQVMMLTGGDPNGKTSVLQYLLYDRAFNQFEFGEASAIGMISAVTIVALTIILNRVFKLDNVEQEG